MAALMAMESGVSYAASNDLMSADPSITSASSTNHDLSDVSLAEADMKRVPRVVEHTPTTPSTAAAATSEPKGWVNRLQDFEPANYRSWGERNAVGFQGKMLWAGVKMFDAADFLGEVFADFLGITDSRYQYVVDAYERHQHELAMEALEEESELQRLEERVRKQRTAEAKREEEAAATPNDSSDSTTNSNVTTSTTSTDATIPVSGEAIVPPAASVSV